ncbi:MAG: 30S ribosome-binding factor RbfA [Chlamydiota bacterium]|nr:30S ribosome-binding factor RbfA [Chlamydiota bacterium]
MAIKRTDRLNSLLKEVISEVITKEVKNPSISEFITITRVEVTKDLHYAKVYFSVIGDEKVKQETFHALKSASGFIATKASKKVRLRFFPSLTFKFDDTVEKHVRISEVLKEIEDERQNRATKDSDCEHSETT